MQDVVKYAKALNALCWYCLMCEAWISLGVKYFFTLIAYFLVAFPSYFDSKFGELFIEFLFEYENC